MTTAVETVSVGRLFAVQGLGQSYRGHPLSDSGLAVEEIGVGQAAIAYTRLEQGDGLFVACDFGEGHVS